MSRVCHVVFVVLFMQNILADTGSSQCGKVHLTVSAQDAFLELNWITNCSGATVIPDQIVLSRKNMAGSDEDHGVLFTISPSESKSGYYKTKVKFGQPYLPGGWDYEDEHTSQAPGPHCFPYWIASINNNVVLDSRCLAIQPTWMADNRELLGNTSIDLLLIPGTHNAGAFLGSGTFFEKFILNQDRDIWTQLVFGIRYLDFRIAYYGSEGFYLNHDLFRIQEVRPLFQQIKKFLQASPGEIVILDFHRFPYPTEFELQLHNKFIDIVQKDLGEFVVPAFSGRKTPTLNDIWATNKNLIIAYNNQQAVEAYGDTHLIEGKPWLWYPIHQYWADTKSVPNLKRYIQKSIHEHDQVRRSNPLWALMAELTPQAIDIIFGTYSLKKLAQDINREITKWFRDEFGENSNIVATDYFLGNDVIDIAIDINTKGNRSKTVFR